MSLINNVLRDLARHEREGVTDLLSQVQVVAPAAARAGAVHWGRTLLFVALVTGFTTLLLLAHTHRVAERMTLAMPNVHPALVAAASAQERPPPHDPAPQRFRLEQRLDLARLAQPGPSSRAPTALALKPALALQAAWTPTPTPPAPTAARRASPRVAAATSPPTAGAPALAALKQDARAAQRDQDWTAAEKLYREILTLQPDDHAARLTLIGLLLEQGRGAEAERLLPEQLPSAPAAFGFRRLAAQLALSRGAPDAALEILTADAMPSLAADPEFHAVLAVVYQKLDRHQEAAELFRSLLQLRPGAATWWVGYAISLEATGARNDSLMAYLRARRLGTLDPRLVTYAATRSTALQEELDP